MLTDRVASAALFVWIKKTLAKEGEGRLRLFRFRWCAIEDEFSRQVIEYHREGGSNHKDGDPCPEDRGSCTGEDLREFKII